MLSVIMVFFVAILIAVIEIPLLLKKKLRREIWTFSIILFLAVGLSVAHLFGISILNPIEWINGMYTLMFKNFT